jgi:hypothetical protein
LTGPIILLRQSLFNSRPRDEVLLDQQRDAVLYFGFAVFFLFEARVPEIDIHSLPPAAMEVYTREK